MRKKTNQDFQNFCVIILDMLVINQKLLDPFFTGGRLNDLDVFLLQTYFEIPERNNKNMEV